MIESGRSEEFANALSTYGLIAPRLRVGRVWPPVAPMRKRPAAQPDLGKLADEAQGWLADMVRINTVNPPGNEAAVAKYISAIFQKEGISNEVLEIAPGRSIVIARLQAGPLARPGECSAAGRASGYGRRGSEKMDGGSLRRGHPRRLSLRPRLDRRQGHARGQHRHDGRAQAHAARVWHAT